MTPCQHQAQIDTDLEMDKAHEAAWDKIKVVIDDDPVLRLYLAKEDEDEIHERIGRAIERASRKAVPSW
jgi:hypothetical protein